MSSVRYYVPIKLVKLEPKQVSETTIQHACETCVKTVAELTLLRS